MMSQFFLAVQKYQSFLLQQDGKTYCNDVIVQLYGAFIWPTAFTFLGVRSHGAILPSAVLEKAKL